MTRRVAKDRYSPYGSLASKATRAPVLRGLLSLKLQADFTLDSHKLCGIIHHRDTEDTEVSQRRANLCVSVVDKHHLLQQFLSFLIYGIFLIDLLIMPIQFLARSFAGELPVDFDFFVASFFDNG